MTAIQVILEAAIAVILLAVVVRWRRGDFGFLRASAWTATCLAGAAFVFDPELSTRVAKAVGVGRGADLVAYLSIVALFYAVFRLLVRTERLRRDITEIVRQIAIERRLREDAGRDSGRPPA